MLFARRRRRPHGPHPARTARRRGLVAPPGYATLADVGLDGPWVTPPQMSSRSPDGPVLLAWHFLGAGDARWEREAILADGGYSAHRGFNVVLDMALGKADLGRSDVYVTQLFHLLTCRGTSFSKVPAALIDESWERVTRYEVQDRVVVALGRRAESTYRRERIRRLRHCRTAKTRSCSWMWCSMTVDKPGTTTTGPCRRARYSEITLNAR